MMVASWLAELMEDVVVGVELEAEEKRDENWEDCTKETGRCRLDRSTLKLKKNIAKIRNCSI